MSSNQSQPSTSQGGGINIVPVPGINGDKWMEDGKGNIFVQVGPENYKWLPFSPTLKDLLFPDLFTAPTTNEHHDNKKSPSESSTSVTGTKKKAATVQKKCPNWTDPEVRNLIEFWTEHRSDFEGTVKSNDQVWNEIVSKEGKHTPKQLKEKWKTLKKKFASEIDKIGDKGTGGEAFDDQWKFFDDFYDLFKTNPQYKPKVKASSRFGCANMQLYEQNKENPTEFDNSTDDKMQLDEQNEDNSREFDNATGADMDLEEQIEVNSNYKSPKQSTKKSKQSATDIHQLPPSKKTKMDKFMESIEKSRQDKEEKCDQRHKQTLQLTTEAVGYLGEISNSIKILSMKKTQKD